MIEAEFRKLLADDSTVAGLVGKRIYPTILPQQIDYPAIVLPVVRKERIRSQGTYDGLCKTTFNVYCSCENSDFYKAYEDAKLLAETVRIAIDDYSGTLGTETVQYIEVVNERDLPFTLNETNDDGVQSVVLEVEICHIEGIGT